jgi:purine nucleoside permease
MTESEIKALLTSLSRPHSSGGVVIERAAIAAAGSDFPAVMDWITAHAGVSDDSVAVPQSDGLHGSRMSGRVATPARPPLRFVLPAGALP